MSNFLKNLFQIRINDYNYETNKWNYKFKYLWIDIDLFLVDFSFGIVFWFTRESFVERDRMFNEYLQSIFEQFELTEVAPAPKNKAAKKAPAKKPVTKKKTSTKK